MSFESEVLNGKRGSKRKIKNGIEDIDLKFGRFEHSKLIDLPLEIWLRILKKCDPLTLISLSMTTAHFYDLTNENFIWKHLYQRGISQKYFYGNHINCSQYIGGAISPKVFWKKIRRYWALSAIWGKL